MPKRMNAIFSDKAYEDLRNGKAVDNNGLRSPNGSFYPDQPSFSPVNDCQEQLKKAGTELFIAASGYFVFQIVLPGVKQFSQEKVYPFLTEKWDEWQENRKTKKATKQAQSRMESQSISQVEAETKSESKIADTHTAKIINLDGYLKRA